MPNFTTSSDKLMVRPVRASELPALARMARGPSFNHFAHEHGSRQRAIRSRAADAAALLRRSAQGPNEQSVNVWLSKWLKRNEASIVAQMEKNGDTAFVLQVNYAVSDNFEARQYLTRDVELLGSVPSLKQVDRILTEQTLIGMLMTAVPKIGVRFQQAYLVGELRR